MTDRQKVMQYLNDKQIDKHKIVVMSQQQWEQIFGQITATNHTRLKNYLFDKQQITFSWEYSSKYVTFRKV